MRYSTPILLILSLCASVNAGHKNRRRDDDTPASTISAQINVVLQNDIALRLNQIGIVNIAARLTCSSNVNPALSNVVPATPFGASLLAPGCNSASGAFSSWRLVLIGINGKEAQCASYPGLPSSSNPIVTVNVFNCPDFPLLNQQSYPPIFSPSTSDFPLKISAPIQPLGPITAIPMQSNSISPLGPVVSIPTQSFPIIQPLPVPMQSAPVIIPGNQIVLKAIVGTPVQNQAYPIYKGSSPSVQSGQY
jgi:hypothetical protein